MRMRIAVVSDEPYPVHSVVLAELARRGHTALPFGSVRSGQEEPFALAAEEAARAIADGHADEGVFLCWTGTGVSIAANKVAGVRAALCADPVTAAGARIWNHANVLCLSNRTLSGDVAKEILTAWFDTEPGQQGADGVAALIDVDTRNRG